MKLHILDNGWLECDANTMVAGTIAGTRSNQNPCTKWIKIPVFAVLIETTTGKILYDTGCPAKAMEGYWPQGLADSFPYYFRSEQAFKKQLELAGTKPEEIDTVILSHMHLDHAGNIGLFKNAKVIAPEKDFKYGVNLIRQSTDRKMHGAYIKEDLETPLKDLILIKDEMEICQGIKIICLPGHTPDLLGLVVHLKKDGIFVFPMDAIYTRENYGPPPSVSGIVYDSLSFFSSIEKVRRLEAELKAKIIFSHDMDFFKGLKKAPDYYE